MLINIKSDIIEVVGGQVLVAPINAGKVANFMILFPTKDQSCVLQHHLH
jgi:hypothetical protein